MVFWCRPYICDQFSFKLSSALTFQIQFQSLMSVYHDEVEIEDFEYDSDSEIYYYPCPCGDRFEISKVKLCLSIIILPHLSHICYNYLFGMLRNS